MIALIPALAAASANSTAPCRLCLSVKAMAGSSWRLARSTMALIESVESRKE
jgi:hypothetical protein